MDGLSSTPSNTIGDQMDYSTITDYDYQYEDPNSITDSLCKKGHVVKIGSITVPILWSIVVILSVFGNVLVLVILSLYETLRSLTNVFILNLAVSDLLFTFGLPFWACYYIWGWTLGDVACKVVSFIFSLGFYSSVLFLVLMTIQRYMAVVHPLSDWERGKYVSLILVVTWAVSISAALPALILSSVIPDQGKLYCELNSTEAYRALTYEQNLFFICAFVVMSFCYIGILQTIFKAQTNKRHRTIRLIFCLVAVFFVGWAPYNLVIFLKTFTSLQIPYFTECEVTHHLDYSLYLCQLLAFSHCCLNPVFYVFVGVKFRNHLKVILQKIFQRPSNTGPSPSRTGVAQSLGSMY